MRCLTDYSQTGFGFLFYIFETIQTLDLRLPLLYDSILSRLVHISLRDRPICHDFLDHRCETPWDMAVYKLSVAQSSTKVKVVIKVIV